MAMVDGLVKKAISHQPSAMTGFTLRGGLKNGVLTTTAGTRWRTASTVISKSSGVPSAQYGASIVASAISFFRTGDHVVVVARPTCLPPRRTSYTGTAARDAAAGICGARPSAS